MRVIFTICTNNYLAQAKVLGMSLKQQEPGVKFLIVLCDEKRPEIDYATLADEVISVADIEPQIHGLAERYNIIELSTCVKPRVMEYLQQEGSSAQIMYLDPDIKVFQPLTDLFDELNGASIILTPHIYTPVPVDQKKPGEHTFLNFGIYNLGFIGLANDAEARRFTGWWKERTYKEGYFAPERGLFVDQLPVNHAPLFFRNVKILYDMGANMAPWNLHERYLSIQDGRYMVNEKYPLKFYHFSSFGVDTNELPLHHYDRFTLAARPDLQQLYSAYNADLKAASYAFYQQFESSYSSIRKEHIAKLKRESKLVPRLLKKLFAG